MYWVSPSNASMNWRKYLGGFLIILLLLSFRFAPTVLGFTATPLNSTQKYSESIGKFLGRAVALSADGQRMVIGAFNNSDDLDISFGYAYIYEQNGGLWQRAATLAADIDENDWFGVAVAIDGNTAVVGASRYNGCGADNAGAAFVYTRQTSTNSWVLEQRLCAPTGDNNAGDSFGFSVAVQGDLIAVGARFDDHETGVRSRDFGAVYLFRRSTGTIDTWAKTAKITVSTPAENDYFGQGIDLDGNLLAVRSHAGALSTPAGAVHVVRLLGYVGGVDQWEMVTTIPIGSADSNTDEQYNFAVAIRGDLIVTGAYLQDETGVDSGVAYLFGRHQGGNDNWGLVKKLLADDTTAGDNWGIGVDVTSTYVAVGAIGESADAINAGAVYLFVKDHGGSNNWGLMTKLVAPAGDANLNDNLGRAVALQGNTLAIGAVGDNANQGAVYLHTISTTPTPTYTSSATPTPTATGIPTGLPSDTPTPTPSHTPTPSFTPSPTGSTDGDMTATATPTPTPTPIPPTGTLTSGLYLALVSNPPPLPPTAAPTPTTLPPQWQLVGKLPNGELISTALALQGDQLLVGARNENKNGGLYQRSLTNCAEAVLARLDTGKARTILGITLQNGRGALAAYGEGLFYLDDNGVTWKPTQSSLDGRIVTVGAADGPIFYAGTDANGIYRSVDNGKSWQHLANPKTIINRLRLQHQDLWFSDAQNKVWFLAESATTPIARDQGLGQAVWDFAFDNAGNIYLATAQGVFKGNGVDPWQIWGSGLPNTLIRSLGIVDQTLYAGTEGQGVWQNSLDGGQWQKISSANWIVRDLLYAPTCNGLLAATDKSVWLYR